ncbi:MAG: putative bifunctional diguanylate cyclase/phosphodiesterase [Sulfuricella sp.]|nr:EAL domain-containing protein [Gammaproteobacteria bacterium]
MTQPLRLLLVEDSDDDALLVVRELSRNGFAPDHTRVDTSSALRTALDDGTWDIVITDHNMPGFNSEKALAIVREKAADLPVIIVSGSIGEDIAVAAMKDGAHDYIMKDNLARLAPAIERELRDAKTRREHRQAQETIEHMAYHDTLTGLANRFEFEHQLRRALETMPHGHCHALLYVDLDQFKIINDTCGHMAGDELLRQVAMLLKNPIRGADMPARLGGDEFGVLLQDCTLAHAQRIGERMLELIRDFRFTWQDRNFNIGASIGLVMLDRPGLTLADVLRQADMACYAAKDKGRNRIQVYLPDNLELRRLHGEMEWVNRINHALEQDRFVLHHQHIVSLNGATPLNCYEFLVRMHEAESGDLILPSAFIPAAERYGLMPAMDRWVVTHCFAELAACRAAGTALSQDIAFVNLSGATLNDEDFLAYVKGALERTRLPAQSICFEITETAAIANLDNALAFIDGVKSLGCHVALDDFGSGLSSFSYLKSLPADFLKIDGAFIRNMLEDPMDAAIVESINSIGHVAGLKTIAEFVETDAIRSRLVEIGVDYAQGFGIHRPEALPGH